jgi:two-component system, cell cycle sensor histidine kinase and response regulator CckA
MDITVVVLSSLSLIAFIATAVVLILRGRYLDHFSRIFIAFLFCVVLYSGIELSNVLEHAGTTSFFDPLEDLAEVVFTLVFLFFIHTWRRMLSERRFRELFKLAPLPLAEVGRDGRILEVNNTMAELLDKCHGITIESAPNLDSWWKDAFPDLEHRKEVMRDWGITVEKSIKTGSLIRNEEKDMTCRDGSIKTVIMNGSMIGDNLLLSIVDITERKNAEAEKDKLRKQFLQAQKLEAIGVLAGGVAHDFNNILGAIIGYAEICLEDIPIGVNYRENVEKILDAAQRSSGLTRQLLIFARKQASSPEIVDVNGSIETMLKMLRRLIGENITLAWLPAAGTCCKVKIDPTHLDQILVNLCVNARDAISNVGRITIKTGVMYFDDTTCRVYLDCTPGGYVKLSVSDDGCGMDKETSQHVFEPFFTTKGVGKGTGLGMSTVYGIVRQCNGFINLYSEPGLGTTIDIYFPIEKNENVDRSFENNVPQGRGENVLLVEDDAMLIDVSRNVLEKLGYRVLPTRSSMEALEWVRDDDVSIDLVLTDVIMPEMNGRELIDRVLKLRTDVKFIFMSGYTADVVLDHGVVEEDVQFIQKPFSKRDIALKLRDVLEGRVPD